MSEARHPVSPAIAEAAAEWIVRRDGGPLSATDDAAYRLWLADPAHREAINRLESVWGLLDERSGDTALPPPLPVPGPKRRIFRQRAATAPTPRRRAMAGSAIAASLALVAVGAAEDWTTRLRADHRTGVGERQRLALADGSTVHLDSHSAIAVDFSDKRRGIRLLAGSALFEVSPDRARPFTVDAAGGSVTALGTAFAVRTDGANAEVVVTEHTVKVAGSGRTMLIGKGQQADFGKAMLRGPVAAPASATAWTRGRLIVANRPLGDVVAEIARYRRGYVTVAGPAARLRVSGVYDLDHPLAAIDSIERSLGLSSLRVTDRIIVLRR